MATTQTHRYFIDVGTWCLKQDCHFQDLLDHPRCYILVDWMKKKIMFKFEVSTSWKQPWKHWHTVSSMKQLLHSQMTKNYLFWVAYVTTKFKIWRYLRCLLDFPLHWRLQYLHPPEQKQWKRHFHIETHLALHEVFVKSKGVKSIIWFK